MSSAAIAQEQKHSAHNYHPLPVVFTKALGAKVWDPEGKEYLDFLSAYSAVNQGHCHPKIVKALCDQAQKLTLSSRAFHAEIFGEFAEYITNYFGFDKVLPMNTGAEAVETGIKIARKWGYLKKGIPAGEALVLAATENFHGRTLAIVSMSTDNEATDNYGPYLEGVGPFIPDTNGKIDPKTAKPLRYNNIGDVEEAFNNAGSKIAAFLVEPIQGEAGIIVPDKEYLQQVRKLCDKHNVLLICDEIQTGIARTGKLLCFEHSEIRPDMVLLGKAISGGVTPVSAVLADNDVMDVITPGTHGSTYGGNPLACAVAMAALDVVKDEKLVERAERLGNEFRAALEPLIKESNGIVTTVRGKGLLNAIVIDSSKANGRSAWDLCVLMSNKGLLAKPTHENIIRLAPPLVITDEDMKKGLEIIRESVLELPNAPHAAH
ncbi:Ornithine aminotransferase [Yarrowia sp. C11]|nr:Ornithine aminotransferase [Yarrowia sp. E02]KAG5373190.1 Ornithine aminotransferase [Yarrowia sp. C11]